MRWLFLSPVLLTGCIHFVPIVNTTDITNVDFSRADDWARGEACEYRFLTIFGPYSGPNSIRDAAVKADIVRVRLVESSAHYFFLFTNDCTIVYGETQEQLDKDNERRARLTPPAVSAKPN